MAHDPSSEAQSTERLSIFRLIGILTRFMQPYWRRGMLVGLGLLCEMAFAAALPFSLKFIIDDGLIGGDHSLLVRILIALAIGGIAISVIGFARDFVFASISAEVLRGLRSHLFSQLQRLSLAFFSRSRSGDVLGRFSTDLGAVETALINAIPWGVLPTLDVIANTALLLWLDWRLALVALLSWPVCLLGPRLFARRAVSASYARKQDEGAALALVQENVQAQPAVKAFNLAQEVTRRFEEANDRLSRSVWRVAFLAALVERSAALVIMLMQVLVLAAGAYMAASGLISVGTLAAFLALFLNASLSLAYATQYIPTLVNAAGGMERIDEVLSLEPGVKDRPDAVDLPLLEKGIELKSVLFGYDEKTPSLRDVSLALPADASIAIVGPSGSGKSTILGLLMRLYEPHAGRITFDGIDVRSASQESLRRQIGVVFQDSFLFDTTIRENIRLGRLDATPAEIEAAAKEAEIHDVIVALPDGYDTVLGERGGRLSGGQRRRVDMARAILRDPRILVLDEATAALDPATEAAINHTLARISRGRMTVTVTHRLAAAIDADCIHVMDQGRIVESGRHDELLARGSTYARLWSKQSGFGLAHDGHTASVTPERLRQVPLFAELDEETLGIAASLFTTERLLKDRIVIQQGDIGDRFYIVIRGAVEVLVADETEATRRIAVLEIGDHFGEIALLRLVRRTASVRTLRPSTFLALQRAHFELLLQRAPQLRARMEDVHRARLSQSPTA